MRHSLLLASLLAVAAASAAADPPIRVVASLSVYGSIAELVGGERVEVSAIARGDEDAHFVKPKPSYALMLRDADLFVSTGLDLELWAPVLIDKSRSIRAYDGLGLTKWASSSPRAIADTSTRSPPTSSAIEP